MNFPGNSERAKESDPAPSNVPPPYQPSWRERAEDLRPYLGPAVACLVIGGVAGWWSWQHWGRHAPRTSRAAPLIANLPTAGQVATIEPWEATLQKAVEAGADDASLDLTLTGMIEQQRTRLKEKGKAADDEIARLTRMEKVRGALRARIASARSAVLEQEAVRAEKDGLREVALEKRREALKWQREANANTRSADLRNLVRESQLDAGVTEAEAKPLHDLVLAAQDRAKAAAAVENWTDALQAYREARALQIQINGRYSSTRFANIDAVESIDSEIASINAASLATNVATHELEGEMAVKAGSLEAAADAYAAAAGAQKEINERFSGSRFASTVRADEFLRRHDTVLSMGPMARVAALEREAAQLLREGRSSPAMDKIGEARALCEKTMSSYPRSRVLDQELRLKVEYLSLRRQDVPVLQDRVLRDLAPLPGKGRGRLLRTEVPQDLFLVVMNFNPSRHAGPALPVDSVTWQETREFCRRLSWILGTGVRLPTESEFRGAFSAGPGGFWSDQNADRRTHEAGKSTPSAAGFCDLAGNVAEWLQPLVEVGVTAPVAGGSFLDTADRLKTFSLVLVPKQERSRQIGFRFVVEESTDP